MSKLPIGTILTDLTGTTGPDFYGHSALVLENSTNDFYEVLDFAGKLDITRWTLTQNNSVKLNCNAAYLHLRLKNVSPRVHATILKYENVVLAAKKILRARGLEVFTESDEQLAELLQNIVRALGVAAIYVSQENKVPQAGAWSYFKAADFTSKLCAASTRFPRKLRTLERRFEVLRNRLRNAMTQDFPDPFFCSRAVLYVLQSSLYWLVARCCYDHHEDPPTDVRAAWRSAAAALVNEVLPLSAQTCHPRAILKVLSRRTLYWDTVEVFGCLNQNLQIPSLDTIWNTLKPKMGCNLSKKASSVSRSELSGKRQRASLWQRLSNLHPSNHT